jgi:hypothetical protein
MEIAIERNYNTYLIFKAENVNVEEDIESRVYGKTEDGRTDYRNATRDIKTDVIEQFVSILDDMIYYREADFDSSGLIERLFEKLPQDVCDKLIIKLKNNYENE